jgi:hypothetical protein
LFRSIHKIFYWRGLIVANLGRRFYHILFSGGLIVYIRGSWYVVLNWRLLLNTDYGRILYHSGGRIIYVFFSRGLVNCTFRSLFNIVV